MCKILCEWCNSSSRIKAYLINKSDKDNQGLLYEG